MQCLWQSDLLSEHELDFTSSSLASWPRVGSLNDTELDVALDTEVRI